MVKAVEVEADAKVARGDSASTAGALETLKKARASERAPPIGPWWSLWPPQPKTKEREASSQFLLNRCRHSARARCVCPAQRPRAHGAGSGKLGVAPRARLQGACSSPSASRLEELYFLCGRRGDVVMDLLPLFFIGRSLLCLPLLPMLDSAAAAFIYLCTFMDSCRPTPYFLAT